MGRTRTRGAAVLKEGRGGGRLAAYKCVRMCVCQVTRCGGAPCVYPVDAEGTAEVGRCNRSISRVHALCSSSLRSAPSIFAPTRFPRFRGGKGCDEERIVSP